MLVGKRVTLDILDLNWQQASLFSALGFIGSICYIPYVYKNIEDNQKWISPTLLLSEVFYTGSCPYAVFT